MVSRPSNAPFVRVISPPKELACKHPQVQTLWLIPGWAWQAKPHVTAVSKNHDEMSYPQKVHAGIIITGILAFVIGYHMLYGYTLVLLWVVAANILATTLKCTSCGKSLRLTSRGYTKLRGWGKCAHCGAVQ